MHIFILLIKMSLFFWYYSYHQYRSNPDWQQSEFLLQPTHYSTQRTGGNFHPWAAWSMLQELQVPGSYSHEFDQQNLWITGQHVLFTDNWMQWYRVSGLWSDGSWNTRNWWEVYDWVFLCSCSLQGVFLQRTYDPHLPGSNLLRSLHCVWLRKHWKDGNIQI